MTRLHLGIRKLHQGEESCQVEQERAEGEVGKSSVGLHCPHAGPLHDLQLLPFADAPHQQPKGAHIGRESDPEGQIVPVMPTVGEEPCKVCKKTSGFPTVITRSQAWKAADIVIHLARCLSWAHNKTCDPSINRRCSQNKSGLDFSPDHQGPLLSSVRTTHPKSRKAGPRMYGPYMIQSCGHHHLAPDHGNMKEYAALACHETHKP